MPVTIEDLIRAHHMQFEELAVSPDNQEALVVFGSLDVPSEGCHWDQRDRSLWQVSLVDGHYTQLTDPAHDARAPAWSPGGDFIAYVCRESGRDEVWVMERGATSRRQLTTSHFGVPNAFPTRGAAVSGARQLHWSPDSQTIACTCAPNGAFDGIWHVRLSSWSDAERDGQICVLGTNHNPSDVRQRAEQLFQSAVLVVDAVSGASRPVASETGRRFRLLGWFPDGRHVAALLGSAVLKIDVISGERSEIYSGPIGLALLTQGEVVLAYQDDPRVVMGRVAKAGLDITAEVDGLEGFSLLEWSDHGEVLFGSVRKGALGCMAALDARTGAIRGLGKAGLLAPPARWPVCSPGLAASLHRENGVVFSCSGPAEPPDVWRWQNGRCPEKITRFHPGLEAAGLGEVRIVDYRSGEWSIEGLLVLPATYEEGGRYPLLLFLHGGPHSQVTASFECCISARSESAAHWLATFGYAVLLPNFRGSTGYGQEFKGQGAFDQEYDHAYSDVMAGVDHLIEAGIADPDRLGVYGKSYGANLAAWTIGNTTRFKAAVTSIGNAYDRVLGDRLGGGALRRWGRDAVADGSWYTREFYERVCPMEHITSVQTPLMVIETGAERGRGLPGGMQLYRWVRALGVETCYVWYPHAFHGVGWNDQYKADYMRRLLAWFNHCLNGADLPDWFNHSA